MRSTGNSRIDASRRIAVPVASIWRLFLHVPRPKRQAIDRVTAGDSLSLVDIFNTRRPCILEGMIESWPALHILAPKYFKERFPELVFSVSKDLPRDRSPLHRESDKHVSDMNLKDFIDLIYSDAAPCYLSRVRVSKFPGLDKIVDFKRLLPQAPGKCWSFLWIGSEGTNSGLHFDLEDTLLAQVYGEKEVVLVSPQYSRFVPTFSDNVFSSPIEPDMPDLDRFPKFAEVEILEGKLNPGDTIFIPQPWWHSLRSLNPSISASYVFGREVSMAYLLRLVAFGGPTAWVKTATGFVVHGLLGKGFVARIYSPAPTGRFLFELVRDGMRRRLPWAGPSAG